MEIIDSRVIFFQHEEQRRLARKKTINDLKTAIDTHGAKIGRQLYQLEQKIEGVFDELNQSLQDRFSYLGVNNRQQQQISDVIIQAKTKLEHIIETSIAIDGKPDNIDNLLNSLE
jgi:ABC-type transporter Mla subunit MlaD